MKIKRLVGCATEGWRIASQVDAFDLKSRVVVAQQVLGALQLAYRVADGRLWFRISNLP